VGLNTAASSIILLLRLVLGGIFIVAAGLKLSDPQAVADSILGFKLGAPDHLVLFATYAVPWAELFAGAALVFGFWTRAGALLYSLALAGFIVAIISVIQRDLSVECQCLGRYKLYCTGPLGTCKVIENSILLAGGLLILTTGGGAFSLDRLIYGQRDPGLPA
jgi:uncharacterized membrane protein YphA (DoxX/SURF4 family)